MDPPMLTDAPGPVVVCSFVGRDLDQLARGIRHEAVEMTSRSGAYLDFAFEEPISGCENLAARLREGGTTILQIVSHGGEDGTLSIDDVWGSLELDASTLGELLKRASVGIVVLSCCHGAEMARQLAESGACRVAIGVDFPLSLAGVRGFSSAFYHALALGKTIIDAFEAGRAQAVARMGTDINQIKLYTGEAGVEDSLVFHRPTFYFIGDPSEHHEATITALSRSLAPYRVFHVDDTVFGEDEFEMMMANLTMARIFLVLFEGHRVQDARALEQITRAVGHTHGRRARIIPLYLEGTTPNSNVPFNLMRLKPAYLNGRRYRGDVVKLARDLKALAARG